MGGPKLYDTGQRSAVHVRKLQVPVNGQSANFCCVQRSKCNFRTVNILTVVAGASTVCTGVATLEASNYDIIRLQSLHILLIQQVWVLVFKP